MPTSDFRRKHKRLAGFIGRHPKVHVLYHQTVCRFVGPFDKKRVATSGSSTTPPSTTPVLTTLTPTLQPGQSSSVPIPGTANIVISALDQNGNAIAVQGQVYNTPVGQAAIEVGSFTTTGAGPATVQVSITQAVLYQFSFSAVNSSGSTIKSGTIDITGTSTVVTPPPTLVLTSLTTALASGQASSGNVPTTVSVVITAKDQDGNAIAASGGVYNDGAQVTTFTESSGSVTVSVPANVAGSYSITAESGSITSNATSFTGTTPSSTGGTALGGVLCPLYLDPGSGGGDWAALATYKNAAPNVPCIAIVNPGNGKYVSAASTGGNYVAGIDLLHAAGIKVFMYIDWITAGGSPTTMESYITSYHNDTGYPGFDGFFCDDDDLISQADNQAVGSFATDLGYETMGNPGTYEPSASYFPSYTYWCIYETAAAPPNPIPYTNAGQPSGLSPGQFAAIWQPSTFPTALIEALMPSQIGWVYVTSVALGTDYQNPPQSKPYLQQLFTLLANGGGGSTPPGGGGGTDMITVTTTNASTGASVTGEYVTLTQSGTTQTGNTPISFTVTTGVDFTVQVEDYTAPAGGTSYTFLQWSDNGSTVSSRTMSISAPTTIDAELTASGSTTTPPTGGTITMTVSSIEYGTGGALSGNYFEVYTTSGGSSAGTAAYATGYTPASVTLEANTQYWVFMEGYKGSTETYTFDYWQDNQTLLNNRNVASATSFSLVAVYTVTAT